MGSKAKNGEYFRQRVMAEPRLTDISDDAAIRLFEGMINSCRIDSDGDKIQFALLVNDMLKRYNLRLRDLYPVYRERIMPKDPNGAFIDYESLVSNTYNFDWREELKDYLDTGLLRGRPIKQ